MPAPADVPQFFLAMPDRGDDIFSQFQPALPASLRKGNSMQGRRGTPASAGTGRAFLVEPLERRMLLSGDLAVPNSGHTSTATVMLSSQTATTFLDKGTASGMTTGLTPGDWATAYLYHQEWNVLLGASGRMRVQGFLYSDPSLELPSMLVTQDNRPPGAQLLTLTEQTAEHLPLGAQAGDLLILNSLGQLGLLRPPAVSGLLEWQGAWAENLRALGNPLNPFFGLPWMDTTRTFDLSTQTANVDFSALINIQLCDFNDLTVYAGDGFADVIVSGHSEQRPFIARVRYIQGRIHHARVLVSSTILPMPGDPQAIPIRTPGVAVSDDGVVLTTLPTPLPIEWATYRPVAFGAEFPEGNGPLPHQLVETPLWSQQISTNSRGDFIITSVPEEAGRTQLFEFAVMSRDLANLFLLPFSNIGSMRVHNGLQLVGPTVGHAATVLGSPQGANDILRLSNDRTVLISTNLEGDSQGAIRHPVTRVIKATYAIPDLTARNLSARTGSESSPLTSSDHVLVDFDVANIGTGLATGISVELRLNGVQVFPDEVALLASPADSAALSIRSFTGIDLGKLSPGSYVLTARIDPANQWAELDESNNEISISFEVIATSGMPDRFEPNDSADSAADLGTITSPHLEAGLNIHQPDNDDWFRFMLAAPGDAQSRLEVLFEHAAGDLDVLLYRDPAAGPRRFGFSSTDNEVLNLNGLEAGTWYLRVYGFQGAVNSYDLRIIPPTPPVIVLHANFHFATAPQSLRLKFDQNVSASLTANDLQVVRIDGGRNVPVAMEGVDYDADTHTATFRFGEILPDGNYRATLPSDAVANSAGAGLAENFTFDFWFLMGDANRDRMVNVADFSILAGNFAKAPATFNDADFNYDGKVSIADFNVFAIQFGRSLPPEEPAPTMVEETQQASAPASLSWDRPLRGGHYGPVVAALAVQRKLKSALATGLFEKERDPKDLLPPREE